MKNSTLEQQSTNDSTFGSMQVLTLNQLALIAGGIGDSTEAGPNEPGSGDRDIGGENSTDDSNP